jgi:hypothetical protein
MKEIPWGSSHETKQSFSILARGVIMANMTIHIWLVSALRLTWSLPALGLKLVLGQKHGRLDKTALTLIKKVTGEAKLVHKAKL